MKILEEKKEFQPIHLILETQEEVDKLYTIFNHSALVECLNLRGHYLLLEDHCDEDNSHKLHKKIEKTLQRR